MKRKTWSLIIKGERWIYRLLPKKEFDNLHNPEDSDSIILAKTLRDAKQIDFKEGQCTLKLARHELFHAYNEAIHITAALDLKRDDYEEVIAELLENSWDVMDKQFRLMHKNMIEYEKNSRKETKKRGTD